MAPVERRQAKNVPLSRRAVAAPTSIPPTFAAGRAGHSGAVDRCHRDGSRQSAASPAGVAAGVEPGCPTPASSCKPETRCHLPLTDAREERQRGQGDLTMMYLARPRSPPKRRGRSPRDWTIERQRRQKYGLGLAVHLPRQVQDAVGDSRRACRSRSGRRRRRRCITDSRNADWIRDDIYFARHRDERGRFPRRGQANSRAKGQGTQEAGRAKKRKDADLRSTEADVRLVGDVAGRSA